MSNAQHTHVMLCILSTILNGRTVSFTELSSQSRKIHIIQLILLMYKCLNSVEQQNLNICHTEESHITVESLLKRDVVPRDKPMVTKTSK